MGACASRQNYLVSEQFLQKKTRTRQQQVNSLIKILEDTQESKSQNGYSPVEYQTFLEHYERNQEYAGGNRQFLQAHYLDEVEEDLKSCFELTDGYDQLFWIPKGQINLKDLEKLINVYKNELKQRKLHINLSNNIDSNGNINSIRKPKQSYSFLEKNPKFILSFDRFSLHIVTKKSLPIHPWCQIDFVNAIPDSDFNEKKDGSSQLLALMKIPKQSNILQKLVSKELKKLERGMSLDFCNQLVVCNEQYKAQAHMFRARNLMCEVESEKDLESLPNIGLRIIKQKEKDLLESLIYADQIVDLEPTNQDMIKEMIEKLGGNKLVQEYETQGKWALAGEASLILEEYQKAIEYFDKERNPSSHVYVQKAKAYYNLKNYREALNIIRNQEEVTRPSKYFLQGKIYKYLGEQDSANKSFESGLMEQKQAGDKHSMMLEFVQTQYFRLAELYELKKIPPYDDKIEFSCALREKKEELLNEALIFEQFECYEEMIDRCTQILSLLPNSIEAKIAQSRGLIKLEKYEQALQLLNECLEINQDCMKALQLQRICYSNLKQQEQYTQILEAIQQAVPKIEEDIKIKYDIMKEEKKCDFIEDFYTSDQKSGFFYRFIFEDLLKNSFEVNKMNLGLDLISKTAPQDIKELLIKNNDSVLFVFLSFSFRNCKEISKFSINLSESSIPKEKLDQQTLNLSLFDQVLTRNLRFLNLNFGSIPIKENTVKDFGLLFKDKENVETLNIDFSNCKLESNSFYIFTRVLQGVDSIEQQPKPTDPAPKDTESEDSKCEDLIAIDIELVDQEHEDLDSEEIPSNVKTIEPKIIEINAGDKGQEQQPENKEEIIYEVHIGEKPFKNLNELILNLRNVSLQNKLICGLGEAFIDFTNLKILNLDLSGNYIKLDGLNYLFNKLSRLAYLECLGLDLSKNQIANLKPEETKSVEPKIIEINTGDKGQEQKSEIKVRTHGLGLIRLYTIEDVYIEENSFKNLEQLNLNLSDNSLGSYQLYVLGEVFNHFTNLKILNLDFSGNYIKLDGIKYLFNKLSRLAYLEYLSLDLSKNQIANPKPKETKFVEPKITEINTGDKGQEQKSDIKVEPIHDVHIEENPFKNLEKLNLNLSDNSLGNQQLYVLGEVFNHFTNLKILNLDFSGNYIKLDGIKYLFNKLSRLAYLEYLSLDLSKNQIANPKPKETKFVEPKIIEINTGDKGQEQKSEIKVEPIHDVHIEENPFKNLEKLNLNLSDNSLGNQQLYVLGEVFIDFTNLKILNLDLSENYIQSNGIKYFTTKLSNLVNLEYLSLDLSKNQLSILKRDFQVNTKSLSSCLASLINLKELKLYMNNSFNDKVKKEERQGQKADSIMQLFQSISTLKSIKSFTLEISAQFTSKAGQEISQALQCYQQLENIDLDLRYTCLNYWNSLDYYQSKYIFTSLSRLPRLKKARLNLSSTQISDLEITDIAKSIQNIKGLERLQLDLSNNKLTKEGISKIFDGLSKLVTLKDLKLKVSGNQCSQEVASNLYNTYPKLKELCSNLD